MQYEDNSGKLYKIIQVFPKAEEQVATDIFKVSITGGIELSYIISQNCPHIAPPYPEGATVTGFCPLLHIVINRDGHINISGSGSTSSHESYSS